ncbi:hypothetical protein [Bombella intestini]|uniref:hypothetical protein n=1 Tax=Bombella intestini TaxID=1539051 RepID=UPI001300E8F6|nr:hypothetical protein [Bombella intestini]
MSSNLKDVSRPILGLVQDVIEDLVMDHPWGWAGFAFFVGTFLGRKKKSCQGRQAS